MFHLFKPKKKTTLETKSYLVKKPNYKVIKKLEFGNSRGFRGYKRFHLAVYGDPQCDIDLPALHHDSEGEIGNAKIVLKYVRGDSWGGVLVYADGKKIGTYYESSSPDEEMLIDAILHETIDSVHVRVNDDDHVVKNENDKSVTVSRIRSFLFVRFIDN